MQLAWINFLLNLRNGFWVWGFFVLFGGEDGIGLVVFGLFDGRWSFFGFCCFVVVVIWFGLFFFVRRWKGVEYEGRRRS